MNREEADALFNQLENDTALRESIFRRAERVQSWVDKQAKLTNTTTINNLQETPKCFPDGLDCMIHYCQGDPNIKEYIMNRIIAGAFRTVHRWEWLNKCYGKEERRLFAAQAKSLRRIAGNLKNTPYVDKVIDIAEQLEAEVEHPIMPEATQGLSRKKDFKAYAIRQMFDVFREYFPIRTLDKGYAADPWQRLPNQEIAIIVSMLTESKVTNKDVAAALRKVRRKNYMG